MLNEEEGKEMTEAYMSMTVMFSFILLSLFWKTDSLRMRCRMGPTTTDIQCGSVVVDRHVLAVSNTSTRVSSIRIKSFGVSEKGGFVRGGALRRACIRAKVSLHHSQSQILSGNIRHSDAIALGQTVAAPPPSFSPLQKRRTQLSD